MFSEKSKFNTQAFQFPDINFTPIYSWVWNSTCTVEIIDEQLAEMQRLGIRAFYIIPEPKEFRPYSMPTDLTPDYLTPDYLDMYAYAIEKGRELGMRCWIYDEGGWPSGGACGKVLADHPEYAKELLHSTDTEFLAGSVYTKHSDNILAAFLPDGTQIEEGYAFLQNITVTEYFTVLVNNGGSDFPDLLNKDATEYFLKITHDAYATVLRSSMGRNITAVFTDEPSVSYKAFNDVLIKQYAEKYGESILPYLPLLAEKIPVTDENIHILYRWYDLCSQMFCDHFLKPCKEWINSHGMMFTGHMNLDHYANGCVRGGSFHLMRALRCLDIPGVDVIWRQIYPISENSTDTEKEGYNGFFPRYASSAAAQNGTNYAMTETFGVFSPGLTYDLMRYSLGFQAIRGINILNPMVISMGRSNVQLAQELPSFTEDQIYYKDLSGFNRYLERLSYLTSLGARVCDTALYFPIHDFWGRLNNNAVANTFDALGRAMEDKQVDFDIIDDDVLQTATGIEEGYIRMGKAAYRHIIIPTKAYLPDETIYVLERFVKAGGKVSYTENEAVPAVQIEGSAEGLRAMHRTCETGEILCLFRETGETDSYTVHVSAGNVYRLSAESGNIYEMSVCDGMIRVSLCIGETVILLITEEKLSAQPEEKCCEAYTLLDDFSFHRALGLTFGAEKFENIIYQEDAVPLTLGDWSPLVGCAYSGSGTYQTVFCPDSDVVGKSCILDLGDVRYTASVRLNGWPLGTRLMPPYRYSISAGLLKKENILEITVTNTPANAFVHTDFFDKWETWQLSPYYVKERVLAKDSVFGGLYGPVKLFLCE